MFSSPLFVSVYCERLDASWLAEPLGLFSNLAFLGAGYAIARRVPSTLHLNERLRRSFAGLCFAIGIGSGLYHAIPNPFTRAADVIPIALFAGLFFLSYLRCLSRDGQPIRKTALLAALAIALPALCIRLAGLSSAVAGGEFYLGLVPAMLILGTRDSKKARGASLNAAALLFIGALSARTIDQYLCPWWPYGTHFIWHILNACVVYRLAFTLSR